MVKGLPWLLSHSQRVGRYINAPENRSYALDISYFSNANLTMEILGGNTVSFRCRLGDFLGTTAVPARWGASLETQ